MNLIINLWQKYIIDNGITEKTPDIQKRKTHILNHIAIWSFIIITIYAINNFSKGNYELFQINLAIIFIALITFVINYQQKYFYAQLFFCIGSTVSLATLATLAGETRGTQYILFPASLLPLLFFESNRLNIPLFILNIICFFLSQWLFPYMPTITNHNAVSIYYINLSFVFILMFMVVKSFQEEYLKYLRLAEQRTNELMTKNKDLEKVNDDITQQKYQIEQSINAAQMIQNAIIPEEKILKNHFQDYFIINQPKSIVSGDFWWIHHNQNQTLLIVADCTGHGVPGAFMTLIANKFLENIILQKNITEPTQILEALHEETKKTFTQVETYNNIGLDLAVLRFEKGNDSTKVDFAGAKRPFLYAEAPTWELKEIEGERRSIGGGQNEEKPFVSHHFSLPIGSICYLFTDGYADQNDEKRKKIGKQKLYQFLQNHLHETFSTQKSYLEQYLALQMTNTIQRDDILFVGLQL
ncbi:MAG: hypothetical protein EAZ55_00445 [Cytophagales bacterium]|nr:MAG: hypothetical protein EAZ55_00445 [Cytophagales bacterium]